jgi:hypothetical protein
VTAWPPAAPGARIVDLTHLVGLDFGSPDKTFCAAPLLTGGGDGGFCRAFAAVPS